MLNALKATFLDSHRVRGFRIHESFPLVIQDPTVLFTNATITPFKSMFTGAEKRENYALVQRCLRLGGTGGNLETPRSNLSYTSLFDMLGSGLFDVSQDEAVAYFVEVLIGLGLRKEKLVFTTTAQLGFESALEHAGVLPQQIRVFADPKELQHEWSFGEGDLHGCGVVAWYTTQGNRQTTPGSVLDELSHYVQIGRIVHIDGIVRGAAVETFPHAAYDMGIGFGRVELALAGDSKESLHKWRVLSDQLQSMIPELSATDGHYMANLYRVVEELVCEGLLPGNKKQAYALRKVVRLLIEEIWLKSTALVDILTVLDRPIRESPCRDALTKVLSSEETALRGILSVATKKQQAHPEMSPEELRATFGVRLSLLRL